MGGGVEAALGKAQALRGDARAAVRRGGGGATGGVRGRARGAGPAGGGRASWRGGAGAGAGRRGAGFCARARLPVLPKRRLGAVRRVELRAAGAGGARTGRGRGRGGV